MRLRFLRLCVVLVFVHIFSTHFFSINQSVANEQEPTLKMMNWNIGARDSDSFPGGPLPSAMRIARMRQLASLIVQEQASVVTLQEFVHYYDERNDNDLDHLLNALNELKYPMHTEIIPYYDVTQSKPYAWSLVTLSQFPINSQESQTVQLSPNRRARISVIKDTPLGNISVANFHTNLSAPCKQMQTMINAVSSDERKISVVAGDANITFTNFYGQPEHLTKPECKSYDWSAFNNTCKDAVYNCKPGDHACRNSSSCWGDYVYSFRPSNLFIKTIKSIGNAHAISDAHPAIIAEIGSFKPAQPVRVGDINNDGVVDIFDYNKLLQSFGKTGGIGFDPADIIQNGVIDIYDLNALLQNFGV
ncbi:hypothetical protein KA078_00685 [Candidatus Woesebacteria bacterium]|nr:hypothetical protein [Candidatus Woesebacteria bacterium]